MAPKSLRYKYFKMWTTKGNRDMAVASVRSVGNQIVQREGENQRKRFRTGVDVPN